MTVSLTLDIPAPVLVRAVMQLRPELAAFLS